MVKFVKIQMLWLFLTGRVTIFNRGIKNCSATLIFVQPSRVHFDPPLPEGGSTSQSVTTSGNGTTIVSTQPKQHQIRF
jgi:hypothetical protein